MPYGATSGGDASGKGTLFKLNPATKAESVVYSITGGADGANPEAALTSVGKALYGTTFRGGATALGTVLKVTL
jgi:uncharacterized repeat protein (TIGR03803 family)